MSNAFKAVAATACLALVATLGPARAEPPAEAKPPARGERLAPQPPGPAPTAPTLPPPPYIYHSTVNNPAADTTDQSAQLNSSVIDLGGGNLFAAFDDTGSVAASGQNQFTGYAYSSDDGFSWTDGGFLPFEGSGDLGYAAIAHHKAGGVLYLATRSLGGGGALKVFRSADNGRTFAPSIDATPGSVGGSDSGDLPAIAVDNFGAPGSGAGNVYVCAATVAGGVKQWTFTRSTDGGASYGPTGGVWISTGGSGCAVVVSPSHQINVFYYRGDAPGGSGGDNKLYVRRSRDRGLTFGNEIVVADLATTTPLGDVGLLGDARSRSFPQPAVNPVTARPYLYVVYNDIDPAAPGARSQIYYVRSTDAGATWSAPARANDDSPGDQFLPSIAFASGGDQFMISYASRSQNPTDVAYHRRARIGVVTPAGGTNFNASFQLGPNAPAGEDRSLTAGYIGEFERMGGGAGAALVTWADARSGNAFHRNQSDIRFARIALPPPAADLSVTASASPASVGRGDNVVFTVTAKATGGTANDVFVSLPLIPGFAVQSVNTSSGQCSQGAADAGCSLGAIAAGSTKSLQIVATATTTGSNAMSVRSSTSSADGNAANNSASAAVTVTAGGAVNTNHSTGSIGVAIVDGGTVDIPIAVSAVGNFLSAVVRVRLDHTYDSDLRLSLVSPTGQIIALSDRNGGSGDNYGSGPNSCGGTFTMFRDDVTTPISAGVAPFAGKFKPEQPLSTLVGVPTEGTWKLRVQDAATTDTGTIGCFEMTLTRTP